MRSPFEEMEKGKPGSKTRSAVLEEEDRQLICFKCSNVLTLESKKINVSGRHSHFYTNPAGNKFDLRCFSDASGCVTMGVPIPEFTWFPGYKWCFAFCSKCSVQSGWFYLSTDDSFFGLIREAFTGEYRL